MTGEQTSQPVPESLRSDNDKLSWPRAVSLVLCAVYGPQLLMCLYTLLWISCSHCKLAVWMIAPVGPGLFLYEWARSLFGLQHFSSETGIVSTCVLTVLMLFGLTAWIRQAGRFRIAVLVLMASGSAALAFALLAAIRA